jgi:hypothetical protein
MINYLKSKLTIGFAIFGAGFSLVLGAISRIPVVPLLIRVLVSGFVMGGVGILILVLTKRFLPEEEIKEVFSKDEKSIGAAHKVNASKLDVVDDSEITPEDLIEDVEDNEFLGLNAAGINKKNAMYADDEIEEIDIEKKTQNMSKPPERARSDFKEISFEDAPRVYVGDSPAEREEETPVSQDDLIKSELDRLKEKAKGGTTELENFSQSHRTGGDSSFTIGNKKISADPKLIARAIKTVLKRD